MTRKVKKIKKRQEKIKKINNNRESWHKNCLLVLEFNID